MKLLSMELRDTKGRVYRTTGLRYVADSIYKDGTVTELPKKDPFKIALVLSKTIRGKRVFKRKVQRFPAGKRVPEVIRVMTALQQEVEADFLKESSAKTSKCSKQESVPSLNEAWLNYCIKKERTIKESTLMSYKHFYNKHISEKIGHKKIDTITKDDLNEIMDILLKTKAPRTAHSLKQILRPLFKANKEWVKDNPVDYIETPSYNNEKEVHITKEQERSLYQNIFNYEVDRFRGIFTFLAHGRRQNEVLSLKWKDIDLERNEITITAETNKAGKVMVYQLTGQMKKVLPEKGDPEQYVFPSIKDQNKKMDDGTLRNHWNILLKRSGIDYLRKHDLRHLIGGALADAGESLITIAAVLGHTSTAVTQRYSKQRKEVAAKSINEHFERLGV